MFFLYFTANREVITISSDDESLMSDAEPDSDVGLDHDRWLDSLISDDTDNIDSHWIDGMNDDEQLDVIDQYIANHGRLRYFYLLYVIRRLAIFSEILSSILVSVSDPGLLHSCGFSLEWARDKETKNITAYELLGIREGL